MSEPSLSMYPSFKSPINNVKMKNTSLEMSGNFINFVSMIRCLRIFIAAFAALLMLCGCHKDEPQIDEPQAEVSRTILVYMAAKNNLSYFSTLDLGEMMNAEVPDDCRLVVFRSTYGEDPQLVEIENGRLTPLKTYDAGTLAADKETLIEVLADVEKLAPSRSPAIIFWSHSTGWKGAQKVAPTSRSFGLEQGREIELPDLAAALRTAPRRPAFIMFDSCYMGCVEVAYELRDCADYLISSVCEVPSEGMPYERTLPLLFNDRLAEAIDINVDYYVNEYLSDNQGHCPSTMSLIRLSGMEALARASAPLYADRKEAEEEIQHFSVTSPFKNLFVDLQHFMEQTSAASLDEFNVALRNVVVHERHTASIWGQIDIEHCCGLSVNPEPESTAYNYQATAWFKDVISNNGVED